MQIERNTIVTFPPGWKIEIVCNADRGAVETPPPRHQRFESTHLEPGMRLFYNPRTVEVTVSRAFDAIESISYDLDETDRLRVIGQILDLAGELGRGR